MAMKQILQLLCCALGLWAAGSVQAQTPPAKTFALDYTIELLPKQDQARITMALGKGSERVTQLSIGFDAKRYSGFKATGGKYAAAGAGKATWTPAGDGSKLTWLVRITRQRDAGDFDARMTPDWALFRGDKVIPFVTARMKKNTVAVTHLGFVLPSGWNNVVKASCAVVIRGVRSNSGSVCDTTRLMASTTVFAWRTEGWYSKIRTPERRREP